MRRMIAIVATMLCVSLTAPLSEGQKAATTVAGKWHFLLDTQGGDREVDASFDQDGKNVTGKFGKDDVKGTFADGKLKLEFAVNPEEVGPGTMKIAGELVADALSGKWEFQEYGGTFKATRKQ